ncbi:DUF1937 family protein [uncultured Alsobacter sp.]|uniref:DUF1937 family protein n=1 Tax=uncultured Alsobacter sp. TaxID=1748258 RepID=UPI0025F9E929|nr:DUF1937 family protein [uncultured Alsobacter sp.]
MAHPLITALAGRQGFVYLATPYTKYPSGHVAAYLAASRVAGELVNQNIRVFCPVAHSHPVAVHGGVDPAAYDIWTYQNAAFLDLAHTLVVAKLPSWKLSRGVDEEIEAFIQAGKPVILTNPELTECETLTSR